MGSVLQLAVKNPKVFAAVIGAVIGAILGVIVDLLLFHLFVRGLVIGFVLGGALGWWQHRVIATRAAKLLLGRFSPL